MGLLDNKVALVTGGGSGIGRSIALHYAREGAKVCVSDIEEKTAKETLSQITKRGGEAFFYKADVGEPEQHRQMVAAIIEKYGALHIACNNAGIGGPRTPIGESHVQEWEDTIRINLLGVFYGMRYQIPEMLKAGGGVIINMASILGTVGFEGASAYVTAKHGMLGLTKNAALEYSSQGIRTIAVGPGFIKTPLLTANLSEEELGFIQQLHPIGRLGESSEIAELVLWLSSEKASFITGAYIPIDGGYLSR